MTASAGAEESFAKHFEIIEALKEVAMQEPDLDYLSPEYKSVLERSADAVFSVSIGPSALGVDLGP